jgi:hypothetical protein
MKLRAVTHVVVIVADGCPVSSRVGSPLCAPAASRHDQNGDVHVINTCPEYLVQRSGAAGWFPSTYRSIPSGRRRLSLGRYLRFWWPLSGSLPACGGPEGLWSESWL